MDLKLSYILNDESNNIKLTGYGIYSSYQIDA